LPAARPVIVNLHIEVCSFPNFNGVDQRRTFVVNGYEMTYVNPSVSFGASSAPLIWKRTPRAGTN
jgi:hypothetical protein